MTFNSKFPIKRLAVWFPPDPAGGTHSVPISQSLSWIFGWGLRSGNGREGKRGKELEWTAGIGGEWMGHPPLQTDRSHWIIYLQSITSVVRCNLPDVIT